MTKKNNHKKKNNTNLRNYARYSSIAIQMMVIVTAGVWGGVELDKMISWKFPVLTILLALISVSVAIYISIKDFIKSDKDE